jgi:hypothetical protein
MVLKKGKYPDVDTDSNWPPESPEPEFIGVPKRLKKIFSFQGSGSTAGLPTVFL